MLTTMRVTIIAAMSENRVIGRNGDLPWRLPADLQRFKRLTLGHPVIMGRRTFDSLPKPLQGRTNVVITRQRDWQAANDPDGLVRVAHDLDAALRAAESTVTHTAFIIGGGEIYALALPRADRLELTIVHTTIGDGDAWFPEFDRNEWQRVTSERHDADDQHAHAYTFETWARG